MSVLASISKPADRAPIITIVGDAGTGKTSLAATFPSPIVIRAEDGLQSIPAEHRPDAFPLLTTADELWPQLMGLLKEKHDYKTVIIDSVSALESLFTKAILEKDGRAQTLSTALGGYGAGFQALAGMMVRLRKAAGLLNTQRGMNVIFISHADLETMRLPDTDDYARYSLRLSPKSLPPIVDDVDMVAFIRLVSALRGKDEERKKIISDGSRELICHATASSVSKNRYGITEPIECPEGQNPLLGIVPGIAGVRIKRKAKVETVDQEATAEQAHPQSETEQQENAA